MGRVAALSLLVALAASPGPAAGQKTSLPGHTLGSDSAAVTIVEYADFACSACAEFAVETWPRVRRELVTSGRVQWRVVPFSLGFRHGHRAARAAECAGLQGAFWVMHDRLFGERERWMEPRRPADVFQAMAAELGLDALALRQCIDDDEPVEGRLEAAANAAKDEGIRATPTFVVNGRPVLGALPFDMVLAAVEQAEAEAGGGTR